MSDIPEWQPIETAPEGKVVLTKIDDANGCRNETTLRKRTRTGCRPMWWTPDDAMYVYYTPTHWMPVQVS